MKKLLTLFLLTATAVNAGPKQAVRCVGRHVKETFTDMRHDPIWAIYIAGAITINALDAGSTVYGVHHGFQESNPIWGRQPSTLKLTLGTAGLTLTQITSIHMLREEYTNSCKREAAQPDSRWWKTPAHTHDPESCKYALDILPMLEWPYRSVLLKGNFDLLTRK